MKGAIHKYREFYQLEPRDIGQFPASFEIPAHAVMVGAATHVLYRSDKLNPTTGEDEGFIDYIHEHKAGVKVYRTDARAEGPERVVPKYIRDATSLVLLGDCIGFGYQGPDGAKVKAEPSTRQTQLYSIPSGKALLVIEQRRRVAALIWGGKLRVEARGIVG